MDTSPTLAEKLSVKNRVSSGGTGVYQPHLEAQPLPRSRWPTLNEFHCVCVCVHLGLGILGGFGSCLFVLICFCFLLREKELEEDGEGVENVWEEKGKSKEQYQNILYEKSQYKYYHTIISNFLLLILPFTQPTHQVLVLTSYLYRSSTNPYLLPGNAL